MHRNEWKWKHNPKPVGHCKSSAKGRFIAIQAYLKKQEKSQINNLILYLKGRRQWHPTPVLLPGKSHGWRSLVGCNLWGCEESDMTEWLHFHFSLSCIGEGNGNPLQCSCLKNPRGGGAWWAAVYAVIQSRTRLKWLSSSSRVYPKKNCWLGGWRQDGRKDGLEKQVVSMWVIFEIVRPDKITRLK